MPNTISEYQLILCLLEVIQYRYNSRSNWYAYIWNCGVLYITERLLQITLDDELAGLVRNIANNAIWLNMYYADQPASMRPNLAAALARQGHRHELELVDWIALYLV